MFHLRQGSGSDHLINIWSSLITEHNRLSRNCPQSTSVKLEWTVQPLISEDLKMETNTRRNIIKGSDEQTCKRLSRGPMKRKSNGHDCTDSSNGVETDSAMTLTDECYRQGDNVELIRDQPQVQESVSCRRNDSTPYHDETVLVEKVSDGMVKAMSHESQDDACPLICDPPLRSEATGNYDIDNQIEEVSSCSSASCVTEEHVSSSKEVIKYVSATAVNKVDSFLKIHPPLEVVPTAFSRRKLLILDINGVLADVVSPPPKDCKGDKNILRRAIFKRPFYYEFLKLCFDKFDVGIWSSRSKKIVDRVVDYLLEDLKHNLLFCWDLSQCTETGLYTLENRHKPLVCKELRKIWETNNDNQPWRKGIYDESNTLLLDDSPHKALLNPMHTAVFPYSFSYKDTNDTSLGPGGDLRVYVEKLATADNMRKFVEEHPFGQSHIDETSSYWNFYSKVLSARSAASTPSYLGNSLSSDVSSHMLVNDA